jgi:hypothetical protein
MDYTAIAIMCIGVLDVPLLGLSVAFAALSRKQYQKRSQRYPVSTRANQSKVHTHNSFLILVSCSYLHSCSPAPVALLTPCRL